MEALEAALQENFEKTGGESPDEPETDTSPVEVPIHDSAPLPSMAAEPGQQNQEIES
jgi:hypothetical protein